MKANSTTALTNDEYRSVKAWSNSDLSNINKGAAIVEWNSAVKGEGSDAAIIGTALHSAILEPEEFAKCYVKIPNFDARSKAGKEAKESFRFTLDSSGKIALSHDDYTMVITMRDSMLAHPVISKLLTSKGESEVSIFLKLTA